MGASRKIVHVDRRGRIALGSFGRAHTYLLDLNPDGSMTLTPGEFTPIAATLPAKKAAASQRSRQNAAGGAAAGKRAPKKAAAAPADAPQEEKP
jgi:hypothetical protein